MTTFLPDYKVPKERKSEPHPLPEGIDGIMRMIDACGQSRRRKALVALIGLCGLRIGEATSIRPCHITVDGGKMTIKVRGKGDVTRDVPVSSLARPFIEAAIETANIYDGERLAPFTDRWARELWSKLGKTAGLSRHTSSHDGRATIATAMYAKSKNIRVVQEFLGHASSSTTDVYTGISMDAMRDAIEIDLDDDNQKGTAAA